MNSSLYKATVMHNRFKPKSHRFNYSVFMFYIDLDEVELLKKKFLFFSHNRFNFFSLRDQEHLQLPMNKPDTAKSIKQQIIDFLKQNNIKSIPEKIMLLTNLNILGYNFNPVSFYYCFDKDNRPICSIAEVGNTFGELKPYILSQENLSGNQFHLNTTKYFYVSPFFNHDDQFDFNLSVPNEKLNVRIDTLNRNERVFISTLTGVKKPLTNFILCWYSVRFPFLTLKIITLIHWNALLLWIKKIPYRKKVEDEHLQRDVFRKYDE